MAELQSWIDKDWLDLYVALPFGAGAEVRPTAAGRATIRWKWPDADADRRYGETVVQLDATLLDRLREGQQGGAKHIGEAIRSGLIRLVSTQDLRHAVGKPIVIDIDERFIGE